MSFAVLKGEIFVLDIAFLLQAMYQLYICSCLLPTLKSQLLEAFLLFARISASVQIFYRFYFCF